MAKYAKYERKTNRTKKAMNPIWRGIGCIMIFVVPLMAYGLAVLFVPAIEASGLLPHELFRRVILPEWTYTTPVIGPAASFISSIDNLWGMIMFFFIFLLVLSGVFSMLYAGIYQIVGPQQYSPLDAEPTKYKAKHYKR